ncbi:MAG TPA: hypothetical protein VJT71_19660 [Pyrinomonadaceae bacterium]|nr:hypothetical protein [Pyrinomonadaceae bacterium]
MASNLIGIPLYRACLFRAFSVCVFALVLACAATAQTRTVSQPNPQPSPDSKHDGAVDFSNRVDEMRTLLSLKEEKKNYEENVARAKEAQQLAADLKASYEAKDAFTLEDQKKLERLEKLTRRIRNEAGGSDIKEPPKDLPETVKSAISCLAEMSEGLFKEVKKTPRRVLSASIIGQANKLIGVIRFVRDQAR